MSWLPLSFGAPMVLWGLIALPVIWWLLRLTPPRPQTETFPPLRILANVLKKEETPHQSPWWLTLLRLLMAALVIFALATPVLNPQESAPTGGGPLAIVMDNDWSSAPDWDRRVATAERLIADANERGVPVILSLTAERANADIGPFDSDTALERLNAAAPRPVPANRADAYRRTADALAELPGATIAVLSNGLAADGDEEAFETLFSADPAHVVWAEPGRTAMAAVTRAENQPEAFVVTATRGPGDRAPRQLVARASDEQGRSIAETVLTFGAGDAEATAELRVPFELRNDFSSIALDGERHAGGTYVLDENSRRRRIGMIAQSDSDQAQPLLESLYYIRRALGPYADLIEPESADLTESVPALLEQKPAVIVMADVGNLPAEVHEQLAEWVNGGGTLIRFAGPRLAASGNDAELLPVRLRLGERSLGGTLSWTEPQPVTDFPATGPFSDLPAPRDVTVSRQVLAEPSPDIVERTWASLADGTPLVTGAARGEGTVVLFHVTPEATWSNLPISGSFVEMLRRIVQLSHNQGAVEDGGNAEGTLAPYRMISAEGMLVPPSPEAEPLPAGGTPDVTIVHPPGLYGGEDGVVAHNLLPQDAALAAMARPTAPVAVTEMAYSLDRSRELKGPLLAAALAFLLLDTLAVLWMGGAFARRRRRRPAAAATTAAMALALALPLLAPGQARAQDQKPGDEAAIAAVSVTRIAYVKTGLSALDSVSRAGIEGLSRFMADKTALEPGDPAGVDIATDELAFYPLIYWPVDPDAPMPSDEAIARVDAYMQEGGTVLFDTRDQYSAGFSTQGDASPATMRLRAILADLNVPPLEPVPDDHVLTKSFYILPEFPGRYRGSPLWVEASLSAESAEGRPVRTGDGVSPIMITANDFAGAWAIDANGDPLLPTVPPDSNQRTYAYRAGVNIMMYMLTGNYKSDQVHVPVLLERLGQ